MARLATSSQPARQRPRDDLLAALGARLAAAAADAWPEMAPVRFVGLAQRPPTAGVSARCAVRADGELLGLQAALPVGRAPAGAEDELRAWLTLAVGVLAARIEGLELAPEEPEGDFGPEGAAVLEFRAQGGEAAWLWLPAALLEAALPAAGADAAVFPSLQPEAAAGASDPDALLDVPLVVSVELGRTERQIRDILTLVPGSVLELDRLAGDPLDVLVNGRRVARAEVLVVDEQFAIRITEVLTPSERLEQLR